MKIKDNKYCYFDGKTLNSKDKNFLIQFRKFVQYDTTTLYITSSLYQCIIAQGVDMSCKINDLISF